VSVRAAPARGATAPSAVAYLRRRTVGRAADAYRRWIGRAVGWWTVLYLLFWVVVFAVAGVESLAPLERRLPHPGGLFALAGLVALLAAGLGGRTPPVILDRRDLYRLGLGPQRPWHVLRWRWLVKQASGVAAALLLGGAWSLVAPAWFGLSAPYAAPALALLAWFLLGYRWLAYVGHPRQGPSAERRFAGGAFGVLTALTFMPLAGVATAQLLLGGASGTFADPLSLLDPLGGLTRATPLTLVVPALLALASHLCVRRTLAHDWPPRFAPQSLVLSQVQALRTFELMAGLAGLGGRVADEGEKRRLLDALHDRPGATRPRRSLPLPGRRAPQWLALAWRTASALYRRPLLRLVGALVAAALAVTSLLGASGLGPSLRGLAATPAADLPAAGMGGLLGDAFGVLLAGLFLARVAAGLLGPAFETGTRPVDPLTRAWGRALPALLLLTLLVAPALLRLRWLAAQLGAPLAAETLPGLIGALTLVGLVVLSLEKYASWSGAQASRWEPQLVAALLAALPALLLNALGVGEWTLLTQLLLLGLVAILPV